MAKGLDASAMPFWPAAMTQQMAAAYCGVSVDTFIAACPVQPISITRSNAGKRYLRIRLDEWLLSLETPRPRVGMAAMLRAGREVDVQRSSRRSRISPPVVPEVDHRALSAAPPGIDPEAWAELAELSKIPGQVVYYRGSLMDRETFRITVLSKPLGKRDRTALQALYDRRGEEVPAGEIKSGLSTEAVLEVWGYVELKKDRDTFVSWHITESGIARIEAG